MSIPCPALFITAPASGQGKTTVTAGLARLHRGLGRRVRVFKTGPDFLDPMILERASGAPVYNLDLWMCGEGHCRDLLHQAARTADLILVEGVMGLYDGRPSGADLAARLGLPLLAVIDAGAMAQTFAAIAFGLARFRPGLAVAGVLANRVGGAGHAAVLGTELPADIPLFGTLGRDAGLELPHRHLGLWQAAEVADLDARLARVAAALAETRLADLPAPVAFPPATMPPPPPLLAGRRIAVARDLAFSFIYQANLDTLAAGGADLRVFSPLADPALPDCDALYLPGGYPELHLGRLADNQPMQAAIQAHQAAGRPLLAECGGLLYLLETLAAVEGEGAPMVGLLPGRARMQPRLANLGLQAVELPHRHLGLWQAAEVADLDARLARVAAALAETRLADLPAPVAFPPATMPPPPPLLAGRRIAVARDLAFSFIYQANLDTLAAGGADLRVFSPLADPALPDCDALYLPGGYPELHLGRLAENEPMKAAIQAHQAAGRPLLAECGGLLYLLETLAAVAGEAAPMVGLLPGRARMQPRLANLGLQAVGLPEGELRGHTFHHSQTEIDLAPIARSRPVREQGAPESVYRIGRLTASYLHLYFPSNPGAAMRLFL